MAKLEIEDLLRFGMIPEFVGRLPVLSVLDKLDEKALVQILTEPKNSIVRQFKHLVTMEGAELTFTDDAVREIARLALKKKSGARGLRAIIEETMLELMFDLPSTPNLKENIVTAESIRGEKQPEMIFHREAMAG